MGSSPISGSIFGINMNCLFCKKELKIKNRKFCSQQCQVEYQYENYILEWKQGNTSGGTCKCGEVISNHVRRYIFEKFDSKCCKCGWKEINKFSNRIPLQINHIDGNPRNHKEENLELLCPNCHSLTESFGNLNRGNGRNFRYNKPARV